MTVILMRLPLPAGVVLVLATPVAISWLVGDLTDPTSLALAAEGVDLDYGIEPITFGPTGDRIVGITACVAVLFSLGLLVQQTVTSRFRGGWWAVLLPLVAVGVILGYGWRVFTAGGIGANIGAGLVLLLGGPLALGLLLAAIVPAMILLRERPTKATTTTTTAATATAATTAAATTNSATTTNSAAADS
ncbi:hypothetical protein CLV67_119102 [Actinoplanes italicus]|uniref:Uncharacterized protein n=1 Tax=Actinoplanes italicus TaxID=113567 RepID=A0A2T0K147_9ACTN|nr:hypothetical protein [Actinoplanes italicus]PRX16521.1 hypothetical protein CLV67_119102 [Actinoplanes italicus]